jgi:TonB family protein
MNKTLLTLLLLVSLIAAKAQTNNTDVPYLDKSQVEKSVDTIPKRIFYAVEKEPSFPGGPDAYVSFLQHNLKYPENAAKQRIEGKVFLSFVVEKDGVLTDITLLRGVSPDLDAEALRVIAISPKWKPGIQNGIPVRVKYNLAIVFKLQPQSISESEQRQMDSLRSLPPDQKIFTAVEHEPGFKGGVMAFLKYLQRNMHYPAQSREKHIQGKVFISFIVERDGSLSNLKVVRGVSDDLDAEALRVLQESPKWDPGIQNGRVVRVAYTIPVTFKLSE